MTVPPGQETFFAMGPPLRAPARALGAALSFALSAACATSGSAVRTDTGPLPAASYFPLEPGSSWAYLVEQHQGDGRTTTVLATTQVIAGASNQFAVQSGDAISSYELRPDGIFKAASKYFVLKDPIKAGAKWPIFNDEGEVRVDATNVREEVPAGAFDGCVRVVEEIFDDQKVEWTYAPRVGPVRMRVFLLDGGPELLVIDSKLKAYRIGFDTGPADTP